jgi:hypothetical protein
MKQIEMIHRIIFKFIIYFNYSIKSNKLKVPPTGKRRMISGIYNKPIKDILDGSIDI